MLSTRRWHRPRLLFRTILYSFILTVTCVQCRDNGDTVPNITKDSFSDYFSVRDSFFNESDVSKCFNLNLVTCLKVSLLGKVDRLLVLTKERQLERSTDLMGGLVTLDTVGDGGADADADDDADDDADADVNGIEEEKWDADESLDAAKEERLNELLVDRLTKFFKDKTLTLKFIPGLTLRVFPAKTMREYARLSVQLSGENMQQVMARTMKMGGMMRSPWMLIGPMITLGMFPFMLANLKYMVMNAFMINNMALMMALRTTVTNLVFGDGEGDNIVYRNKGYSNEFKDKPIDHQYPIRYTVKPYNQINKYRKVYETRPPSTHPTHFQNGGDQHTAGSQNTYSLSASKNTTQDDGPVKYIAHHDYFGKKRPSVSIMSRPRPPVMANQPVKYVEHHDYFGSTNRKPPSSGVRVQEPSTTVKYGGHYDFVGGASSVDPQRNNLISRPVAGNGFTPTYSENQQGKFVPSNNYYPVKFENAQKDAPVSAFNPQNSQFTPTYHETSYVTDKNVQDYLNNVNYNNHQSQGHQNSNELPPNHKINDEVSEYVNNHKYFSIQSRVDGPEQTENKENYIATKPGLHAKTSSDPKFSSEVPVSQSSKETDTPAVNSVVDRDQDSWVAKGDEQWPIIYQDPTTFHQEAKIKNTEVGTVFPVYPGGVLPETAQKPEAKNSVQVSSGIRFENAAPVIESNGNKPVVGVGGEGYYANGEVISVSPHEDSDPALIFQDSLDLNDENEFVNFPQRLIQIQPGQKIDHRIGTDSESHSESQGSHRSVASSHKGRNPTSFPEPLWMFRE